MLLSENLRLRLQPPRILHRAAQGIMDPVPGASDCRRLPGCQRLRRATRRPDVQAGGRSAARERRPSVLAADYVQRRIVLDIDDTEDQVHGQ